eukprot:874308-Prorocentrum_minimum.AAC.5
MSTSPETSDPPAAFPPKRNSLARHTQQQGRLDDENRPPARPRSAASNLQKDPFAGPAAEGRRRVAFPNEPAEPARHGKYALLEHHCRREPIPWGKRAYS